MSTVRARALLAAALGGLLLLGTLPVSANAGDPIFLGAFNTAQRSKTTIWANSNQWALRVKQARVGSAALKLETAGGPPMIVNSQAKVTNLNVDLLDGYSGDDLRTDWAADSADWFITGGGMYTLSNSTVATDGMLVMTGSADLYGGDDRVWCYFEVDPPGAQGWTYVDHTDRDVWIPPGEYDICTSTGWYVVTAPGTYGVRFVVTSVDTAQIQEGSFWFLAVPTP